MTHPTGNALNAAAGDVSEAEALGQIRALSERATPGPWAIWVEGVKDIDAAVLELRQQVECSAEFTGKLHLLEANGKCPATTGCGPAADANAQFIVASANFVRALLAASKVRENSRGEDWQPDLLRAGQVLADMREAIVQVIERYHDNDIDLTEFEHEVTGAVTGTREVDAVALLTAALRSAPAEQDGGWLPIASDVIDLSPGYHAEPGDTPHHLHDVYTTLGGLGGNRRRHCGTLTKDAVMAWAETEPMMSDLACELESFIHHAMPEGLSDKEAGCLQYVTGLIRDRLAARLTAAETKGTEHGR